MGKTRLVLALLLALLTFSLAAHAAQQTSPLSSSLRPFPPALQDRLSPLSTQQELYYGKLIKRAQSHAMSDPVLYKFCTTARLLCSAPLQESKWGHAVGAETTSLFFDTNRLFRKWTSRAEEPLASASKTEGVGSDSFFTQWRRGNSKMGKMHAAEPEGEKQYFREKDLMIGTQLVLPSFIYQPATDRTEHNTELKPSFLPASIARELPPFDMQHLTDLLKLFNILFDSEMAKKMEETIKACTVAQADQLKKKKKDDDDSTASTCVTSVEALLKFVLSMLNGPEEKIQALTNSKVVGSEGGTVTILQTTELAEGRDTVDCHELVFPFKVMGCHRIKETKAMVVRVAEEGGKDMDLLVACHKNTTLFDPQHEAFAQLRSSPGHTEICHFLPNTDIMWISL